MRATYVLPIRWHDDEELEDLTAYLSALPDWVELIVVDGSPDALFRRHAEAWESLGRHLRPDPALQTPMGKVGGVLTGLREASFERLVIADDDVRYDPVSLRKTVSLLGLADCVQPQNYFNRLPWHARWDTGRTLLNRSLGSDFAGTVAVRRTALAEAGGYDGDVIFENLELMRTIRALGGTVLSPPDLYVARRPPSTKQFLSQRVRQAYDDLAIPARMATWLSVIPALAVSILRRDRRAPLLAAVGVAGLAEIGRRRAGGRRYFPATGSLLAPLWLLERGICSWIALRDRLVLGGVPYRGGLVPRAASSIRRLRRRLAARRPEADQLVGPVAERLPPRRSAAAQGDGLPAWIDFIAVGRRQPELPAKQVGTVRVRGELRRHLASLPREAGAETTSSGYSVREMPPRTRTKPGDGVADGDSGPALPLPRGALSEELLGTLRAGSASGVSGPATLDGGVFGEDFQLSLYVLYELHYRGFRGVDEELEWDPGLLDLRASLEADFEARLREEVQPGPPPAPGRIAETILELTRADDAPSLAAHIETRASLDQVREFLVHRSAYQLKEADPHTWAIPRLAGAPKAALVEVQADEYGGGRPDRVHATLFAKAMRAVGLDPAYGAYLDRIPAVTLATVNLMSLFGLHRRLRGATVGHLAAFEISSPIPNGRYAKGLRRLGLGDDALDFFEEHVEADSVHENVALYDLAQSLAMSEPALAGDILFGVRALLLLDARFAAHLLRRWEAGGTSLLEPVAAAP